MCISMLPRLEKDSCCFYHGKKVQVPGEDAVLGLDLAKHGLRCRMPVFRKPMDEVVLCGPVGKGKWKRAKGERVWADQVLMTSWPVPSSRLLVEYSQPPMLCLWRSLSRTVCTYSRLFGD